MASVNEVRHPLSFRILHEIIMGSILLLIITGYYIHLPFTGGGGFLMSVARGVHTAFAIVLIVTALVRIGTMFIGKNRDWRSFVPSWNDLKKLPGTINYYAYLRDKLDLKKKYNPLQMLSYCLVFVLIVFQILSGLALKYPENGAWAWLNYGIFRTEIQTRMAHFVVMWLFLMFLMIHVYLTIREKFSEIKEMHLLSSEEAEEPAGETVIE